MLQTKVKASAINNLTDARYFAAWEVEWLGFNLVQGDERYISPQLVKAMKEWVDGVKIVGEFDLQSPEDILTATDLLELDAVQIGTFATVETAAALHYQEVPVIKEQVVSELEEIHNYHSHFNAYRSVVAYFLLDFTKRGYHWSDLPPATVEQLQRLCSDYPVLLSIGCDADQLNELLSELRIKGLSVSGGAEEKVGFKSFDELDELFEVLEVQL